MFADLALSVHRGRGFRIDKVEVTPDGKNEVYVTHLGDYYHDTEDEK